MTAFFYFQFRHSSHLNIYEIYFNSQLKSAVTRSLTITIQSHKNKWHYIINQSFALQIDNNSESILGNLDTDAHSRMQKEFLVH